MDYEDMINLHINNDNMRNMRNMLGMVDLI